MAYAQSISELVSLLERKKKAFLLEVQLSIKDYINNQGVNCIAIVERSEKDGSVQKTWRPRADLEYVTVLFKFCREKKHHNARLDSSMTDSIIEIIISKFQHLYTKESGALSKIVVKGIFQNEELSRNFVELLVADKVPNSLLTATKDQAVDLIILHLDDLIHQQAEAIDEMALQTVSNVSAGVIARKIAVVLVNQLGVYTAFGLTKLLALPVITGIIVLAVKKIVLLAIIVAFVKLIGVKIGIGAMGGIALAVLAFTTWWIAFDIQVFPRRLGRRVSKEIVESLGKHYQTINRSIGEKIMENMETVGMQQIRVELAGNKELSTQLRTLFQKLNREELSQQDTQ